MSNRATSTQAATTSMPSTNHSLPQEKIAMRAYDKWCKRGCPQGTAQQDWLEAETELKSEMTRGTTGTQTQSSAPRR